MSVDYKSVSNKILEKRNNYLLRRRNVIKKVVLSVVPLIFAIGVLFAFGNINSITQNPLYNGNEATIDGVSIKLIEVSDATMQSEILEFASAKHAQNGSGNYEKAHLWEDGYNQNAEYLFKVNNPAGDILLVVITENYLFTQSGNLVYISTSDYQKLIEMLF